MILPCGRPSPRRFESGPSRRYDSRGLVPRASSAPVGGRHSGHLGPGNAVPPQGPSPAPFFDTINAFRRTEALRAAIEFVLSRHVGAGGRTVAELAEACRAAPRGVRILAD